MPKGQLERLWLGGGALVAVVLLLVGYFMFIGPQRAQTRSVNDQIATAQLRNLTLTQRIDTLRRQNKNLARYQAAVRQARQALPSASGLPEFLRSLQSIGKATLTKVSTLTVGNPVDATTHPAQPTPDTAATDSATTAPAQPETQPTGATASGKVYALPISAQVSGSVTALEAFLTQLQSVQPRAVLISQITLASGTASTAAHRASLSLTMKAFVAPDRNTAAPTSSAPAPR